MTLTEAETALLRECSKDAASFERLATHFASKSAETLPVQVVPGQSEDLYHLMASNFPKGAVYMFDEHLHFTFAEGQLLDELGLSKEQFIGRSISEIFSTELESEQRPNFERAFAGETIIVHTQFQNRVFRNHLVPVNDPETPTIKVMAISQDVTEQKRAEAVLREQERLQIALQKEREYSQIISKTMNVISHEFRTPLAIILTSTELLDRYADRMPEEKRQQHLKRIKEQVQHLGDVLGDISLVLQGQFNHRTMRSTTFDLESLFAEIVSEMQELNAVHHKLVFTTDHTLGAFIGDRRLMSTVLMVLLSNAIKYSAPQTTIMIDLTSAKEQMVLAISDQGIGIPAKDQPFIFEPFYRGSNIDVVGGIGLGLTIVQEIINSMEGTITLQSEINQGTTITVRAPIIAPVTGGEAATR